MNKIIFIFTLFVASLTAGVGVSPSPAPPPPVYVDDQQVDEQLLRQVLAADPNEDLTAFFLQEVKSKGLDKVISELNDKLTVRLMEKLYSILILDPQAEPLALRLLDLKDQKARIEGVSVCAENLPKIILIAKSKTSPTEFWMGLSDGTFWEVDSSHLGGDDPFLQKLMINSMLGNYIHKAEPTLFEVMDFSSCNFYGLMIVKEMAQGTSFEGKDVYFLGQGGFVK